MGALCVCMAGLQCTVITNEIFYCWPPLVSGFCGLLSVCLCQLVKNRIQLGLHVVLSDEVLFAVCVEFGGFFVASGDGAAARSVRWQLCPRLRRIRACNFRGCSKKFRAMLLIRRAHHLALCALSCSPHPSTPHPPASLPHIPKLRSSSHRWGHHVSWLGSGVSAGFGLQGGCEAADQNCPTAVTQILYSRVNGRPPS